MTALRRVAVTGIGLISSLGRGREAHLDAVTRARSGIRYLSFADAAGLQCRIGGEIDDAQLAGDDPSRRDRFVRLALIAASEAMSQASLPAGSPGRTGVIIGTGMGGITTLEESYRRLFGDRQTRMHPLTIPSSMYNAATSAVAAEFRCTGPGFSVVSACSSGTHAVGQAALWIRSGMCDAALAGATDTPLLPGVIRGWEALRVLAPDGGDPAGACRPFSADRQGIVLAEGSAVLVLEEMDQALARGAQILGEISGVGMSMDAGHLTDPTVDGPAEAMQAALRDGGIAPAEIGYINAHGTGTRANDPTETAAIRRVFGQQAERFAVSSTKSMHGHAMGASGAIELALSFVALNAGVIPPTLNLRQADPACSLDYVPELPRSGTVAAFLSNSFGFGGMNAVLAARTAAALQPLKG